MTSPPIATIEAPQPAPAPESTPVPAAGSTAPSRLTPAAAPGEAAPSEATPAPGQVAEQEPVRAELLAADPAGLASLARMVEEVTIAARAGLRRRCGPLPALTPAQLARQIDADLAGGVLPRRGSGPSALLALARWYAEGTVDLADPAAAAHLQPPSLTVAVAADVLANVFNASVDTWDSGPYAVELERRVVDALAALADLGSTAGGVLTSGGTASNLQALLIAREARPGARQVVLCSELAHFSVARACGVLGLTENAVRTVPVDARWRMTADAVAATLAGLDPGETPIAVVATAGTTDFGSIDPLASIATVAAGAGARLHVDAAYGGGALFSDRLRPLLDGIGYADSVTIDLHKTAWQPAAASALLVRDAADFAATERRVAYLNPDDDGDAGYDGLLGCSLATTRRADAVKIAASFQVLGRDGIGRLFETCCDLASYAADRIAAHPALELTAAPVLSTVVFGYRPVTGADPDVVNGALRRRLMRSGTALIGRTAVPGHGVRLKFTLLNPQARPTDIDALLDAVVRAGQQEESSHDE